MSQEREFMQLFESKARIAKKTFAPLLEGLDGYKQSVAAVLMENELSTLRSSKGPLMEGPTNMAGSVGGLGTGYSDWTNNATGFEVIALPMIRRLIPQLRAFDLFSVQPMTQPVGIAFALRFYLTYNNSGTYEKATTAHGVTTTGGGNMGLNADSDAETIWNYNFSAVSGGAGFNKLFDSDTANGGNRLDTFTGETAVPARIKMELAKDSVSPVTRKLAADWTYESMQDMEKVHGLDLQAELVGETAREISTEIDRELIGQAIYKAGPKVSLWTGVWNDSGTPTELPYGTGSFKIPGDILWGDLDGRWFAERMLGLKTRIDEMATQIGIHNRRGRANWMVCSHQLANAFKILEERGFYKSIAEGPELAGGISKVGTLGSIDVYTDPLFENFVEYVLGQKNTASTLATGAFVDPADYTTVRTLTSDIVKNETGYWFLLGYKGPSILDAGIVYMPYIPLMLTGMVYDSSTFQPSVAMLTRYGLAGNMFGTENYYGLGRVATDNVGTDPLPF